jgi:hypothetical protein
MFKNYFFLKYQPDATNRKVVGAIGLQTHPHTGFLHLPLKTSLRGWQGTWFYCENHEPSLPPLVGQLPEFHVTWSEELTPLELPQVAALTNKVNSLKEKGLDRSLRGRTLAGPPSPTTEEASPSKLGVQRIRRPDLGDPGKDKSGAPVETPRRNILGYF